MLSKMCVLFFVHENGEKLKVNYELMYYSLCEIFFG